MPSMLDFFRKIKIKNDNNIIDPESMLDMPSSDSKMRGPFATKVNKWKRKIVDDYYNYGMDLNRSIARIAEAENLNTDQINRIIEEVNCEIYLIEYKKKERSPNRNVEFEIASLPKVKDAMSNTSTAVQEDVKDPGEENIEPKMKKKASWSDDSGDSLNFLNFDANISPSLTEEQPVKYAQILKKKISEKIATINKEANQAIMKYADEVLNFVDALIQYEKLGHNAQQIFEKVCYDANLLKKYQIPVIKAATEKVASMKESKLLPNNFRLDLQLVDVVNKKADEFSLGEFSLIKKAKETPNNSNKPLPNIKTNKQLVKGYEDLVRIALKVQEKQDDLQKKMQAAQKANAAYDNKIVLSE